MRDGKRTRVDIAEVVVGDVLRIGYGDILGADGVYVAGEDIICDESAQTGESEPINKGADKVSSGAGFGLCLPSPSQSSIAEGP